MNGSHKKHELDIPLLNPESYFDSFFKQRSHYYQNSDISKEFVNTLLEEYKNTPPHDRSKCIDIFHELKLCFNDSHPYKDSFLEKLQNKFALYGRIATTYTIPFRKKSDITDNCDIYSLAAIIFLTEFLKSLDFNALNTAIKLCDASCSLNDTDNPLFHFALNLEKKTLEELHGQY